MGGTTKKSTSTSLTPKPKSAKAAPKRAVKSKVAVDDSEDELEEESEPDHESDAYKEEAHTDDEGDAESLHSDALDDDSAAEGKPRGKKRGRASRSPVKNGGKQAAKKVPPRKKRKVQEESDEDEGGVELKEGQEVVGAVVKAPKTGRVPPGQISQNTFDFLSQLTKPECNDREWFKLHEPVYRLAEKEWKDFIEAFTDVLVEVDPQIPHLPPKDVIHRIYRDVRFSNDKTPYKRNFSASFSRGGRKAIFAHYHISIRPGDCLLAAGTWCPAKAELANIRANIQRSSTRLRNILSDPEFVKLFGEPKPQPPGVRQSIFGRDDELKVAPKGIDKDHKDIDLLKCRTFAVVFPFYDKQVLSPDFKEDLARVLKVMRPFVHCMNDMMTIRTADDSDEDGGDGSEEE